MALAVAGSICVTGCLRTEPVVEEFFAPSQQDGEAGPDEYCSQDVELVDQDSPLAGRIFAWQSNAMFQVLHDLPPLENIEYTTNRISFPSFLLFAGPVDDTSFGIASSMGRMDDCLGYTAILIRTEAPDAVDIQPAVAWPAMAGEANSALASRRDDCERIASVDGLRASERFGNPPVRALNGRGRPSTGFIGCNYAVQAYAYGLVIRSGRDEFIISNVAGALFLKEL